LTSVNQGKKPFLRSKGAWNLRISLAGLLGTLVLLASPLDSIANSNLTIHMFQHIGLFVSSAVFGFGLERVFLERVVQLKRTAYPVWRAYVSLIKLNTTTKGLVFAGLIPAIVFSYWHFPPNFDLAATNGLVHISEHLSYIVSGSLVGASILAIPRKFRAALLVFGFMTAGMMGSMMLVWPDFYTAYSTAQNTQMESSLMLFGAVGMIGTSSWFLKMLDVI
jgi:cytochrome c oxidase assembly factor CtaG